MAKPYLPKNIYNWYQQQLARFELSPAQAPEKIKIKEYEPQPPPISEEKARQTIEQFFRDMSAPSGGIATPAIPGTLPTGSIQSWLAPDPPVDPRFRFAMQKEIPAGYPTAPPLPTTAQPPQVAQYGTVEEKYENPAFNRFLGGLERGLQRGLTGRETGQINPAYTSEYTEEYQNWVQALQNWDYQNPPTDPVTNLPINNRGEVLPYGALRFDPDGNPFYGEGIKGLQRKMWSRINAPFYTQYDPQNPRVITQIGEYHGPDEPQPAILDPSFDAYKKSFLGSAKAVGEGLYYLYNELVQGTEQAINLVEDIPEITQEALWNAPPPKGTWGYYRDKFAKEGYDTKEILDAYWKSGRIAYTSFFEPAKEQEFIRRVLAGEPKEFVERDLENVGIEFVGELFLDPFNLLAAPAKAGKTARAIDSAADLWTKPADNIVRALKNAGVDLADEAHAAQWVMDTVPKAQIAEQQILASGGIQKYLDDLGRWRGIKNPVGFLSSLTTDGKRALVNTWTYNFSRELLNNLTGGDVDDAYDLIKAHWQISRKDPAVVAEGLNTIVHTQSPQIHLSRVGQIYSRVLGNMIGDDIVQFGNEAEKVLAKGKDELVLWLDKKLKGAVDDLFPAVDERLNARRIVTAVDNRGAKAGNQVKGVGGNLITLTDDNIAKARQLFTPGTITDMDEALFKAHQVAQKYAWGPMRQFMAAVYMGYRPAFAIRNALNGYLTVGIDEGMGAVFGPAGAGVSTLRRIFDFPASFVAKTKSGQAARETIEKVVGWLPEAEKAGIGTIAGEAGAVAEEAKNVLGTSIWEKLKNPVLRFAESSEREQGIRVMAAAAENAIQQMAREGRAIPAVQELIDNGVDPKLARMLPQLILQNNYNVDAAIAAARKIGGDGLAEVFRLPNIFSERLTRELEHYHLKDQIYKLQNAKTVDEFVAGLDNIRGGFDDLAKKVADEPAVLPATDELTIGAENFAVAAGTERQAVEEFYYWRSANIAADDAYKQVIGTIDKLLRSQLNAGENVTEVNRLIDELEIIKGISQPYYANAMDARKLFEQFTTLAKNQKGTPEELWKALLASDGNLRTVDLNGAPIPGMPETLARLRAGLAKLPPPKTHGELQRYVYNYYWKPHHRALIGNSVDLKVDLIERFIKQYGIAWNNMDRMLVPAREAFKDMVEWDEWLAWTDLKSGDQLAIDVMPENRSRVFAIANRYNIHSITEKGVPNDRMLLNVINKYAPDDLKFASLDEASRRMDVVDQAFKQHIDKVNRDMQALNLRFKPEAKKFRGVKKVDKIRSVGLKGARDDLPKDLSEAIRDEAMNMYDELSSAQGVTLPSQEQRAAGITTRTSDNPEWYVDLYNNVGANREPVLNALQRIIQGEGADHIRENEATIEYVKNVLIDRLLGRGDSPIPVNPAVLYHIGASDDKILAALYQWLDDGWSVEKMFSDPKDQKAIFDLVDGVPLPKHGVNKFVEHVQDVIARGADLSQDEIIRELDWAVKNGKGLDLSEQRGLIDELAKLANRVKGENLEDWSAAAQIDRLRGYAENPPTVPAYTPEKPLPAYIEGSAPMPARAVQKNLPKIEAVLDEVESTMRSAWGKVEPVYSSTASDAAIKKWAAKATNQLNEAKVIAAQVATEARNFALHDYRLKRGFDTALAYIFPYEFWYTRTYAKWLQRMLQEPEVVAAYVKYKHALAKIHADSPEWWRNNVNSNELLGLDSKNPWFFNLEATLNPLYGVMGVDFNDPDKRFDWAATMVDTIDNFGPSIHPLIAWGLGLAAAAKGEKEASAKWFGRLLPITKDVRNLGALMNIQPTEGIAGTGFGKYGEFDPFTVFMAGSVDPYDQRKAARILGQMSEEARLAGDFERMAQIADAAHTHQGPLWDEAVNRAIRYSAGAGDTGNSPARFLPWIATQLGVGFKPRTQFDMQIDQADQQLRRIMQMRHMMTLDEYRNSLNAHDQQYPWHEMVRMARKDPEVRDETFSWSVLGRIPPGANDVLFPYDSPERKLLDKFYELKGDLSQFTPQDREIFMNKILTISSVLALPDEATQAEWDRAKAEYRKMSTELEKRFGEGIGERIGYALEIRYDMEKGGENEFIRYLQENPNVQQAFFIQEQWKMSNPAMAPYYSSLSSIERYYNTSMNTVLRQQVDEALLDTYNRISGNDELLKQFKKDNPNFLDTYYDTRRIYEQATADQIAAVARTLRQAPNPSLRPFPETPSQQMIDMAELLQRPREPGVFDVQPQQWVEVLYTRPQLAAVIMDYLEGADITMQEDDDLYYGLNRLGEQLEREFGIRNEGNPYVILRAIEAALSR